MSTESRVELKPLDEERAADFVSDIRMVAVQIDPAIAHALYGYDVAKVALHFQIPIIRNPQDVRTLLSSNSPINISFS